MPKISIEGTIGIGLEIVLAILDHLHVRDPLIIWGLFLLGLILISDSIVRSDWASAPPDKKTRIKKRFYGLTPVVVLFALFGLWMRSRTAQAPQSKVVATNAESSQQEPSQNITVKAAENGTKGEEIRAPDRKSKPQKTPPQPQSPLTQTPPPASSLSPTPQPWTVNNAPGGFAISGGNVNNPTVINTGVPGRTLKNEDHVGMIGFLAQSPSRISIEANMTSQESYAYAKEWMDVLKSAGWQVEGNGIGQYLPDTPWTGALVTFHGELTKLGEAFQVPGNHPVAILGQALQKTGNPFSAHRSPEQAEAVIDLMIGLQP